MSFNDVIARTEANALIPQPLANEIIKELPQMSAALSLFRSVSMGTKTLRMPVLSALPVAGIGSGDTYMAPTTKTAWTNKELVAEPVKTMVVLPKSVMADSDFPVWDEVKPVLIEAIGIAIDQAVFFNVNKPATWGDAIYTSALAAGNVVTRGANPQAKGGVYKDLIDLMFKVRSNGYRPNGWAGDDLFEQYVLGATDTQGRPLADISTAVTRLLGRPVAYSQPGIYPEESAELPQPPELFCGDFSKAIMGKRQDIGFTMITEGVITNDQMQIIYNLPQQGLVAMLVECRFAFTVANPVTRARSDAATRSPFGVLVSPVAA